MVMQKEYPSFQWDLNKACINKQKHGIDFITVAYVFSDPLSVTIHDAGHSVDESRNGQNHVSLINDARTG